MDTANLYQDKTPNSIYLLVNISIMFTERFAYSAAEVWNTIQNNTRICETLGALSMHT